VFFQETLSSEVLDCNGNKGKDNQGDANLNANMDNKFAENQAWRSVTRPMLEKFPEGCVFRSKAATDSGSNLPLIPVQTCH
jgi:hypothetical protein